MTVTVHYIRLRGGTRSFSSMCFAQLGKGSAYSKNPAHWQAYERFCAKHRLPYRILSNYENFSDAQRYYKDSRSVVKHIELRQEDAFSKDSSMWASHSAQLMKFFIEESPWSSAILSSYKDWEKGVLKIDFKNVTAEMTLHVCQWFRLAGNASHTFNYLQQVDSSNPWRNFLLSYLMPGLWRQDCTVMLDLGDGTLFPLEVDKFMFTDPKKLLAEETIGLSVYDLWGYPMNLVRVWKARAVESSVAIHDNLAKLKRNNLAMQKVKGVFTNYEYTMIKDINKFLEEFDQLWVSK